MCTLGRSVPISHQACAAVFCQLFVHSREHLTLWIWAEREAEVQLAIHQLLLWTVGPSETLHASEMLCDCYAVASEFWRCTLSAAGDCDRCMSGGGEA